MKTIFNYKFLFVFFLLINSIQLFAQNDNQIFTIDKKTLNKGQLYTISKKGIDYNYKLNAKNDLEIINLKTKQKIDIYKSKRDINPRETCSEMKLRLEREFYESELYISLKEYANKTCIPQKACAELILECIPNEPYVYPIVAVLMEINPDIDNVNCNQELRKCQMKDLKADFYLEQTKTNGETIIINTVPKTTTGVEHYWGIVYNGKAPNCNCACEDIPLEDIKNAKTVGVWATHIKADGTFENIGIGTNVTAGTSGLGIKYGGFPYYGCYKITHYIICDKRVESFTTCVGQSSNNRN
jgi:hypothetical protein